MNMKFIPLPPLSVDDHHAAQGYREQDAQKAADEGAHYHHGEVLGVHEVGPAGGALREVVVVEH
jgi:hypothetical protein